MKAFNELKTNKKLINSNFNLIKGIVVIISKDLPSSDQLQGKKNYRVSHET